MSKEPMSGRVPFAGPIGCVDLLRQDRQGFEHVLLHSQKENGAAATELVQEDSRIGFGDCTVCVATPG